MFLTKLSPLSRTWLMNKRTLKRIIISLSRVLAASVAPPRAAPQAFERSTPQALLIFLSIACLLVDAMARCGVSIQRAFAEGWPYGMVSQLQQESTRFSRFFLVSCPFCLGGRQIESCRSFVGKRSRKRRRCDVGGAWPPLPLLLLNVVGLCCHKIAQRVINLHHLIDSIIIANKSHAEPWRRRAH